MQDPNNTDLVCLYPSLPALDDLVNKLDQISIHPVFFEKEDWPAIVLESEPIHTDCGDYAITLSHESGKPCDMHLAFRPRGRPDVQVGLYYRFYDKNPHPDMVPGVSYEGIIFSQIEGWANQHLGGEAPNSTYGKGTGFLCAQRFFQHQIPITAQNQLVKFIVNAGPKLRYEPSKDGAANRMVEEYAIVCPINKVIADFRTWIETYVKRQLVIDIAPDKVPCTKDLLT